ncbi:MAG: methyltransferase domain-containing protein [Pseudomonadota bacterium]
MSGNQLAEDARHNLTKSINRMLGPRAVFFWGFLENPGMVAAVTQSSQAVIDAMLTKIDWANCRLFVEYGPGVGTFCPHILKRLPPGGELLVIDTNPRFIQYLQDEIDDPRFRAVLGSAQDVERIVRSTRHKQADYVLSGLPISSLPGVVAQDIARATYRVLRQGGAFLTYQYRAHARDLTRQFFERTDEETAWRNVPPCLLTWGWKEP